MIVYLDNCAYNRPFDNQLDVRIRLETEAKLFVQAEVKSGHITLVWSYMNSSENAVNPFSERRASISSWRKIAAVLVPETEAILDNAQTLVELGVKAKDALHIASAVEGKADFFLTTDDRLLRKLSEF